MSNTCIVNGPFVTKVHRRLVPIMLAVCSGILGACNPATPRQAIGQDSSPTESRTRRAESLFLIHALGDTYDQWPTARQQSRQLAAWISGTTQRTSRLRAHMQVAKLDPDLVVLYEDCLKLVNAFEGYLSNLGAIEQQAREQSGTDALDSILAGVQTASQAEEDALRRGAGRDRASNDGAAAGLFEGFKEAYSRSQRRNATQEAAVEQEQRKLTSVWIETMSRASAVVEKFTKEYEWTPGEAGFDGFQSQYLIDYVKRRPRDPFVNVRYATTPVNDASPADILKDAEMCVIAADLVPAGTVYDQFRVEFLWRASDLAVTAASVETPSYGAEPSASGARALQLAEKYLAADSQDSFGRGHALLARALAMSHRYTDAIAAANIARRNWEHDANFQYRYAKLMSLTNQLDLAGDWLAASYKSGMNDISHVRTDPDLSSFRLGRMERYNQLTTVKLTYTIDPGSLWDDVLVSNESPFDLTNVQMRIRIRKEQRTWDRDIKCETIKSGQTCKVEGLSPGTRGYDGATATYTCDQSEK